MLSDIEIQQICMNLYHDSESFTQTLQQERKNALDYYRGDLYGNEVEGRSDFVTSEVRDTVEWMLPQLIECFVGPDNPVTFTAKDEGDVEAAQIESEYVRDVINAQNEGFLNLYTWAKDGLLLKNGIVKTFWDERVEEVKETYEDKNALEYQQILNREDIEIKRVTVKYGEEEFSIDEVGLVPDALYDCEVVRTENNSQIRIVVIPPEDFFVEKNHPSLSLEDCSFSVHRYTETESELLADGYPKELIDQIPSGSDDEYDEEKVNRFLDEGGITDAVNRYSGMREIQIYECYIRADFDGNGKSKLWMVKLAGADGNTVLDKQEIDSSPFSVWTPVIETHKFYGMSYADLIMDLQKLRSMLMRGVLDNLSMTNNPGKIVDPNRVNAEDLLYSGPGFVWRSSDPVGSVQVHTTPFAAGASVPIMELTEEMRQARTGVSPTSQGLDPKALSDSTNVVGPMIMTQALQRIKMVARVFAETGYKHLVKRVHELSLKHDNQNRILEVTGKYRTINPSSFQSRSRLKTNVGTGFADKLERIQGINRILQNHERLVAAGGLDGPLLGIDNVYAALVEQSKLLGYVDGAKFYRDPATYNPPPKEDITDKALEIEEAKIIGNMNTKAADTALEAKKHADDMEMKAAKLAQDKELELKRLAQDYELAREEMALKYAGKT